MTLARSLGLSGPGGRDAFGDLFQIAVTAAWLSERDGEPIRNPRAFLRQVIVNQRKMQLRSQRRHPATSFDELAATAENTGGPGVEAIADRRPSVSEQVERRELAELVTQILLTIERRARTVWTMRYLEGRSPDQVMAALDITHRQYSRLFERATTAINRKLLAYLAGDWCPGYASRFASLAAGRATAAQAREGAGAPRGLPQLPDGVRDVHEAAPARLARVGAVPTRGRGPREECPLACVRRARSLVLKSECELGAGVYDCVSSRASVRPGSPETTACTGSSSATVDRHHPGAPLSCMEGDSGGGLPLSAGAGARWEPDRAPADDWSSSGAGEGSRPVKTAAY